jgi:hypothetical protein
VCGSLGLIKRQPAQRSAWKSLSRKGICTVGTPSGLTLVQLLRAGSSRGIRFSQQYEHSQCCESRHSLQRFFCSQDGLPEQSMYDPSLDLNGSVMSRCLGQSPGAWQAAQQSPRWLHGHQSSGCGLGSRELSSSSELKPHFLFAFPPRDLGIWMKATAQSSLGGVEVIVTKDTNSHLHRNTKES